MHNGLYIHVKECQVNLFLLKRIINGIKNRYLIIFVNSMDKIANYYLIFISFIRYWRF